MLHTTLDELMFPEEGSRLYELGQIVCHIEQHGIHYLDRYKAIRHSQTDDKPVVEQKVLEFIHWIVVCENEQDDFSIEMHREYSKVQHLTGWIQKPKIKKFAAKPPINLNRAKARKSLEQIVRTLLIETDRIEAIDGSIVNGKLKDLVDIISEQEFDDVRDIETYSVILKEIRIQTEQSAKK